MGCKILVMMMLATPIVLECEGQSESAYFQYYDFDNGLSVNEINCITQDEDGFLWIGTTSGLNRFDGNSFVQYFKSPNGLAENYINDIISLPHHMLAVATENGLNFFNSRTGTFSTFRSRDTSALATFSNNFQKLRVDKAGNLWALSQTDLYVFNADLVLLNKISSGLIAKDLNRKRIVLAWQIISLPDGNMLIQYPDHYSLCNTQSLQLSDLTNQSLSIWKFLAATDFSGVFTSDAYGRFWFFKRGKDSIYAYNYHRNVWKSFPVDSGANRFLGLGAGIYCLDSTDVLFNLPYKGLYGLSLNQNQSRVFRFNNLPTLATYPSVAADHQNKAGDRVTDFWIGTYDGLYGWSSFKNQFKTVVFKSGEQDAGNSDHNFILPLHDKLWVCSYGQGFYKYDLASGTYKQYSLQLHPGDLISLSWNIRDHRNDTLWVGTQAGLIWFDEKSNTFGRLPFSHPAVLDSFPITTQFADSKGLIWMGIGDGHGVACYSPVKNSFTVYNERSSPEFPLRHPTAITEDEHGDLWMGTQKGGGLVKWDRTKNQFTLFSAKQSTAFSDDHINDLYADHDGNIWIATFLNGLVRYDINSNRFTDFGTEKGLSHQTIFKITGAQYPYLWIITGFGLDRFNIQTKTFEAFYKKDGLPDNELSEGIFYDAATGMMYLGCKWGFIQFNGKNFSDYALSPDVRITDLYVNDQPLHTDLSQPVHLIYKQNNLTVNYTAVDLVNGSDLKFRYRLSAEKQWNDPGKNRQIHFSNLAPGNYALILEAANKSGAWNEQSTTLHFSIQPPWWNTGWFYFLAAGSVIALVYLLYRFRIRQLQRVQEMRNRIAQDLHDDIGGTMTAMNLTNELVMQHLYEPSMAKKLLLSMSEDLKSIGETLDDIVWMVNPKNDSMEQVMARMRRYASRTWEAAGIDFNFAFENTAETIPLNMEQRHDLYLVFKEAVNNVAKHAQCRNASSSLWLKDHLLTIEVKDDGKGFDVRLPSHRNGIKNMQNRMQKWNGKFNIQSASEGGTTIQLQMPITQKGD